MKKTSVLFIVFLVILLAVSGCSQIADKGTANADTAKYTLHVGLNDKNTYKQEITDEKAMDIVTNTSLKYTNGFTVYKTQGVYKDAKGQITKENSLVLEYYGANIDQIKSIMNELLVSLNQESILLEEKGVTYQFYSKKGE